LEVLIMDEFIDLSTIQHEIARRGRRSEVDPAIVERLSACPAGSGFEFPGSRMAGGEFDAYMADKGARRVKPDGSMESADEATRRAMNAWQQKHRQRAAAVATAAGVDTPVLAWHNDGFLILGRPRA
jgi:hypothetical protein